MPRFPSHLAHADAAKRRGERPFAECRRRAGFDLSAASVRLRVGEGHLRAVELGRRPLTMLLAQRMAVAYGTSIQVLTRPPESGIDFRAGGAGKGREASGSASRPRGSGGAVPRRTG